MSFYLKSPVPNFQQFEKVIKGERESEKVHFVEWSVDYEVMEFILSKMMENLPMDAKEIMKVAMKHGNCKR